MLKMIGEETSRSSAGNKNARGDTIDLASLLQLPDGIQGVVIRVSALHFLEAAGLLVMPVREQETHRD